MYAMPAPEDQSRYQSKMIVNMVVAVFLIIGLLLVLHHFNFLFLGDIPVIGGWLMNIYESIFGVPKVLILHGEDSIGDWATLNDRLNERLIFYSEDIDVDKYESGIGNKLSEFGLVIVEDAKHLDKDKLLSLKEYVEGGGDLIWVGDAGTIGTVEYNGKLLATQTGWTRPMVCIDNTTMNPCNCKTVKDKGSTCKYLPEKAEREDIDFSSKLGVRFNKDITGSDIQLEILDEGHWAVAGILKKIALTNVPMIASVSNEYSSALVANLNMGDESYPGVVVQDFPSASGSVVYFAYPPEETMELLMPIVERLRY